MIYERTGSASRKRQTLNVSLSEERQRSKGCVDDKTGRSM